MNYIKYKVEDFLLDQRFREWVLDPDGEDTLFWEEWMKKHPRQAGKIKQARSILLKLPKVNYGFNKKNKDALWSAILQDMQANRSKKDPEVIPLYRTNINKHVQGKNRRRREWIWRVAAVISLLCVSFLLYEKFTVKDVDQSSAPRIIVKENPLGQKSTIFLSDGSEVILNSASKITYTASFGKRDRNITLDGEAFFKVAKDKNLPFKVTANGLVTTALGTSFNVKAYDGAEKAKVALVTGKVIVYNAKNEKNVLDTLMLVPGEQAVFSYGEEKTLKKDDFDVKLETGWKDGIIVFKNERAENVFSYLEKWYGVKIKEENTSSRKWVYSGEFQNMSLHGVLTSIGFTMGFEFILKENKVFITYK